MTFQKLAAYRRYLVLQNSAVTIAYSQQVLGIKDLFGTQANNRYHLIEKRYYKLKADKGF